MGTYSQCKQCYHFQECINLKYPIELDFGGVVWNTIQEKREWSIRMGDCFKSPEQYMRDIESAKKSLRG